MKSKRFILLIFLFGVFLSAIYLAYSFNHSCNRELDRARSLITTEAGNVHSILNRQGMDPVDFFKSYNVSIIDLPGILIVTDAGGTVRFARHVDTAELKMLSALREREGWAAGSFVETGDYLLYESYLDGRKLSVTYGLRLPELKKSVLSVQAHEALVIAMLLLVGFLSAYLLLLLGIEMPMKNFIENRLIAISRTLIYNQSQPVAGLHFEFPFLSAELKTVLDSVLGTLTSWARGKKAFEEYSNLVMLETDKKQIFEHLYRASKSMTHIKDLIVMEANNSSNRLEVLFHASRSEGDASDGALHDPSRCLAFRSGLEHIPRDEQHFCSGCDERATDRVMCLPLVAGSSVIGICRYVFDRSELSRRSSGFHLSGDEEMAMIKNQIIYFVRFAGAALNGLNVLEAYKNQALTDALTGLYNRRYIVEYLTNSINISRRRNDDLAVLMVDIDRFKRFNDEYGHKTGDVVLKEVAHIIRRTVRDGDMVGRYGGEEFICILPGANPETSVEVAERIRNAVREYDYTPAGLKNIPRITLSIGVAHFPVHGYSHYHLTHAADKALYRAKNNGRDRVQVWSHLPESPARAGR